jgi:hypothetical protein
MFRDELTGEVGFRMPEISLVEPVSRDLTPGELRMLQTQKVCGSCRHFRELTDTERRRVVQGAAEQGFRAEFFATHEVHIGACAEKSSGPKLYVTTRLASADGGADVRFRCHDYKTK